MMKTKKLLLFLSAFLLCGVDLTIASEVAEKKPFAKNPFAKIEAKIKKLEAAQLKLEEKGKKKQAERIVKKIDKENEKKEKLLKKLRKKPDKMIERLNDKIDRLQEKNKDTSKLESQLEYWEQAIKALEDWYQGKDPYAEGNKEKKEHKEKAEKEKDDKGVDKTLKKGKDALKKAL